MQDENADISRITRAKSANQPAPVAQKQPLTRRRALGDVNTNNTAGGDVGKGKLLSTTTTTGAGTTGTGSRVPTRASVRTRTTQPLQSVANSTSNSASTTTTTTNRRPAAVRTRKPGAISVYTEKSTQREPLQEIKQQHHNDTNEPELVPVDENPPQERTSEKRRRHTESVEPDLILKSKRPKVHDDRALPAWDDLDKEDADDPGMVSEYVVEIFEHLYMLEKQYMPNPDYIEDQKHITWETRGILVDWLVEVHLKFRLLPETLFLAVNIIDRFMSKRVVSLEKVQLVGIAALLIAAKCEEVWTPSISNYVYVTDGGFTEEQILEAERFVLQVLEFQVAYPNALNFLRRISKADNYDIRTRTIGKYLLETSLLDHRLLQYTPSQCSAAAMYLARRMLNSPEWDGNLIHYSGDVTEQELLPIVAVMVDYLKSPVTHQGFFKKYASKRFMKASILARQWAKEHAHEFPQP